MTQSISCKQVESLMSFYFDGRLTEALKEFVDSHLKICQICREKYEQFEKFILKIRELGDTTREELQIDYSKLIIEKLKHYKNLKATNTIITISLMIGLFFLLVYLKVIPNL